MSQGASVDFFKYGLYFGVVNIVSLLVLALLSFDLGIWECGKGSGSL
jgi:hypothetical protein